MPHVDWNERRAYQKRWKQENATKVRAQKRRARIKKKCLSKSLVVVLDDYRKRMSTPMTKTLVVVLEDYRKKLPTPPLRNKKRLAENTMNFVETIIKEIGNGSEPNKKSIEKGIWKSVERKTEHRANTIGRIHEVLKNETSGDVKTATPSTRDVKGSQKNALPNTKKSGDVRTAMPSTRRQEQRRTNRDALNERRREHRRKHRDAINRVEREYRRRHRETCNQRK